MVDEQILAKIEHLNESLEGIMPYKLAIVPMEQLELLEKNARFMPTEMFKRLTENIKEDGGLASVPFCYKENTRYRVLSGNHRIEAARAAGVKQALILYTDKKLSRQRQVSIQLSHNALAGQDDPIILKELWEEIDDIGLKMYAGLDDEQLNELAKVDLQGIAEFKLDFRLISFLFLPEEIERLEKAFASALDQIADKDIFIGKMPEYDRIMDAMAKVNASYNVRNAATALMLILDIFEKHQTDLAEGWREERIKKERGGEKRWVPMASIFNGDKMPAGAALTIQKAVKKMMEREEITSKNTWQALEYWAADYLSGNK